MVVMAVVIFAHQFKAGRAIPKVKPLHHPHFFKQVHGAINGRQIASAFWQRREDFPVGQRMWMLPQNFQNRRARAGDFP